MKEITPMPMGDMEVETAIEFITDVTAEIVCTLADIRVTHCRNEILKNRVQEWRDLVTFRPR